MRKKVITSYMKGMYSLEKAIKRGLSEERGASDIVAIVVVIVIILAVAVIFRDALKSAMETVTKRLTEFVGK